MVSSGTVKTNLEELISALGNYDSQISGLSGSWQGVSHDSIVSKTKEFSSSAKGKLQSNFNAFANACDLYEQYMAAKRNLETAQNNYDAAVSAKDESAQNTYEVEISRYTREKNKLGKQIISTLATISSTASTSSAQKEKFAIKNPGKFVNRGGVVASAINFAVGVANDNSYGYSQDLNKRWGTHEYDCSALVISAYEQAGVDITHDASKSGEEKYTNYTGNMKKAFLSTGQFEWIQGNPRNTGLELKPGDILLDESDHVEMYVGDGKNVGAHSNRDGVDGDSSGNEIRIDTNNYSNWDGVLRYKG